MLSDPDEILNRIATTSVSLLSLTRLLTHFLVFTMFNELARYRFSTVFLVYIIIIIVINRCLWFLFCFAFLIYNEVAFKGATLSDPIAL